MYFPMGAGAGSFCSLTLTPFNSTHKELAHGCPSPSWGVCASVWEPIPATPAQCGAAGQQKEPSAPQPGQRQHGTQGMWGSDRACDYHSARDRGEGTRASKGLIFSA